MNPESKTMIAEILEKHQTDLLNDWLSEQTNGSVPRDDLMTRPEAREQSASFLSLLAGVVQHGNLTDITAPEWRNVREMLTTLSRTRVQQGFKPSEVATFIFSLKKPLFMRLREACGGDADLLAEQTWAATELLDRLGLFTMEAYQKMRDEVISRQQQEMLELSTPVVRLWDGILALPVIGTLDSSRTQIVMESLLNMIVETGSQVAIIDITGVPTVDTLVAQHLIKTVTAARLMGADCIISGIRPAIAQTIVHLGVDLADVTTKASLADAFVVALERIGGSLETQGSRPERA